MAERFRLPFMAGLLPFAGLFAAKGWRSLRMGAYKPFAVGAAWTTGFSILSFLLVDGTIRDNQSARARISLARAFLEAGDLDQARKETRAALAVGDSPAAHFQLGLIEEAAGDALKALTFYEEASRRDPLYLEPLGAAAALLEKAKDWDSALSLRSRVIEIVPQRFEGYYNKGLTLIDAGRMEQGLELLERAASMAPDNLQVWDALGKAYRMAGKPSEAAKAFRKAASFAPSHD